MSSTERYENTANQCSDFSDDGGTPLNVTPVTLSGATTTDDEVEVGIEVFDNSPPMGQLSDKDGKDNSSVESPSQLLGFSFNKFVKSFGGVISSPTLNQSSGATDWPPLNQSSGTESEDTGTVIGTDDSSVIGTDDSDDAFWEAIEGVIGTDDSDDAFWEKIEGTGLKKRKAATSKKSPDDILDEAMASLTEHKRKVGEMVSYLQRTSPDLSNKKLRSFINSVNGCHGSSSEEEDVEEEDETQR
jgi:hypothetical protein